MKRKNKINYLLIGSLVFMFSLSILLLVIALVCAKREQVEYFNVLFTAFISSIGSFITLLALVVNVINIEKDRKIQREEHEMLQAELSNLITASIVLNSVDIGDYLVPKSVTHINCASPEVKRQNIHLIAHFTVDELSKIAYARLKNFSLYFNDSDCNMKIIIKESNAKFIPIHRKGINRFMIEIITGIDLTVYREYYKLVKRYAKTPLIYIDAELDLKLVGGGIAKYKHKRRFEFSRDNQKLNVSKYVLKQ